MTTPDSTTPATTTTAAPAATAPAAAATTTTPPATTAAATTTTETTPKADAASAAATAPGTTPDATKTTAADPSKPADPAPGTQETKSKDATTETAVPEKYDLKLPEGSLLDPSRVEKIAAFAKAEKLSATDAQEILENESHIVASHHEHQKILAKAQGEKWLAQVKADPEVGGQKYEESVMLANRALETFFPDPDVKRILNDSQLGSHPAVIKGFAKIARAMANGRFIEGNTTTQTQRKSSLYDHPTSQPK